MISGTDIHLFLPRPEKHDKSTCGKFERGRLFVVDGSHYA